jgi:protein PhnA
MDDLSQFEGEVRARAGECCELCQAKEELDILSVPPGAPATERCLLACASCKGQIEGSIELDSRHWFCLKEAAWSEVPAVQVQSWRILSRLEGEDWAQDLLGQVYLDEDTQAWASAEVGGGDDAVVTLDSNGAPLADGDSVTIIKDLDVKGAGFVAKRGTMVKNIRLIDDPENIEGRVNKTTLVLKTKFLKKVS